MSHRFLIGIGSQRAGSTLLHALLSQATEAFMHPLKELHVFDSLHGVRPPAALREFCQRQLLREVDHIAHSTDHGFINDRFRCYLRTCRMLGFGDLSKVEYADLYRPFLRKHSLLGEATPEYMLLDADAIDAMKQVVGGDAAIVLACRHPVDRIASAVKLMNSYNNLGMDETTARAWLRRMLDEGGPWMSAQDGYNDYEGAIERFSSRFPAFVAISYEELIRDPVSAARRIQDGAGIRIDTAAFRDGTQDVKNALGTTFDLGSDLRDELSARYRSQVRFLETRFGI